MHDLDPIVLCVWNCLIDYWFGMLVDILFAWLTCSEVIRVWDYQDQEVNQHSLPKRQVTLSSKVLLFSLYLVDFENMHEKNFILMLC